VIFKEALGVAPNSLHKRTHGTSTMKHKGFPVIFGHVWNEAIKNEAIRKTRNYIRV
jgi:hypothetical protein